MAQMTETTAATSSQPTINVNVGILGHIDSGKTSLAKALSSEASTAAFDKSPQSQQRGITLDLGFSTFTINGVQITLVDHPGHASLIRTVIGGSQIMDAMLLVVDAAKLIQPQTAEGLVIGMLATRRLVVALNKVDQFPAESRAADVARASERLTKILALTPFAGASIIPVTAAPRTPLAAGDDGGINRLKAALLACVNIAEIAAHRAKSAAQDPFLMYVDHCFPIKGSGTVVTGTVLRGAIRVGDAVEVTELHSQHKVKSVQVFRRPVPAATAGDRVGIALIGLDAKLFERGVVAAPGSVPIVSAVLGIATKIAYFKQPVMSKTKFHVTVGHNTSMATAVFFAGDPSPALSHAAEHLWLPELQGETSFSSSSMKPSETEAASSVSMPSTSTTQWVLLELEQPISCPLGAVFIASHLDTDINKGACRLAFHGKVLEVSETVEAVHGWLRLFKQKVKEGQIERPLDARSAIAKGLFKKETDPSLYLGRTVVLPELGNLTATIESTFGKSGKFKIVFSRDVPTTSQIAGKKILLHYKRFVYQKASGFVQ